MFHDDGLALFDVDVTLVGDRTNELLRIVTVFHARQVPVLDMAYSRRSDGSRVVSSTVRTTPRRAATLVQSLRGVPGVSSCERVSGQRCEVA